jgi:hypothetical protein
MNCPQCKEQLVNYVEGALEIEAAQIEAHLQQCPTCKAALEDVRDLNARLKKSVQGIHRTSLESPVMDRIIAEQAAELRRLNMRKRIQLISAGAAGAAVAASVILFVFLGPMQDQRAMAAEVMAKAASQASGLKSVHLKCRMRTLPKDNFSVVGPTYDFVEMDVWKQFGDPAKYRIEKPGRVLVCDGESTVMLIKPNHAVKGPAGANFDAAWLRDLADLERVLSDQLRDSLASKGDMSIKHEEVEGKPKLTVTVEVKAADAGDYMRNKFLMTADTRRVFQFDAGTKRLEAMKIVLHANEQDVLVFEVTRIDYDPQLAEAVFALELPKDVVLASQPTTLPDNEKYASMKPKQAAEAFFEACAKEDWDEAMKFWGSKIDDRIRKYLGGLKVVSIGEPFQSKPYLGWFVPYEIIMKSGETKKFNLAVRNDNPAKRWIVDGGL